MVYALDSNIISYWLKGLYHLEEKIEQILDEGHLIVIPPISYYEVLRGLYANNSNNKLRFFKIMYDRLGLQDMSREDWTQAAHLYAECKKRGTPYVRSGLNTGCILLTARLYSGYQ
jgi:predicted nucleic acid-binding protein